MEVYSFLNACLNSSDGRVVRASVSGAEDLSVIASRVKPVSLKLVFTASLRDAQDQKRQRSEQAVKFTCCAFGKGT